MALPNKIEELKNSLEDGFRITGITEEFNNQSLKTTVQLAKGSKTQEIISINEKEFFEYIQHFQKTNDGYGNSIFIFVDNLEEYRKMQETLPLFNPIRDAFYVEIGDRILTNDMLVTLLQTPGPGVQLARANFFVKRSSNEDFDKIDARDTVIIRRNSNHQIVYKGLINRITQSDDEAFFECEIAPRSLTTEKVNMEFIQFKPIDSLYFVARKTGLTLNLPPEQKIDFTERSFVVIVPIKDLLISDIFEFADVELYSIFASKDDKIIQKSPMCQREPDWGTNFIRAKVLVKSTNHFDALRKGYSKIKLAMNWIIFCNDLTFPSISEGNQKIFSSYNFFKHYSRMTVSHLAYCREINRESTVIFDTRELLGNKLLVEDPADYFKSTKQIFEKIIVKDENIRSQLEKNLILSLHWIARTIGEGNNVDRLLDLWTATELIVLRNEKNPMFNPLEKDIILKKIKTLNFVPFKMEIISSKISAVNEVPLMENLQATVEKFNLSFSKKEWKLIKETRTKRNDIIHGKREVPVTNEEIEKLRSLIERVSIAIADMLSNLNQ